ncbi:unnamed protein product [Cladocopium goreaui]|uniref:Titin n=1 Tax=Cladocopium goreaui TaxID=2562237 RepID=A0A9P1BWP2_9DINO|nr:unnamed protein product [Cladocopium goreaui]
MELAGLRVEEFFPLGPGLSATTQSFLRLESAVNSAVKDEIFLLRCDGTLQLFRPARWHERLQAQNVWAVQLSSGSFHAKDLSEVMRTLQGDRRAFVPDTMPRVTRVEEHCRHANLGLWGWIFRLKHSVLAVKLKGPDDQEAAKDLDQDLLYLDKNADVGVSWRKAGPFERFSEAPREQHGFDAVEGTSLQDVWDAAVSTPSFSEPQEVSNCQHFVRESLEELVRRGHLKAAGAPLTLRNQQVADWLHRLGYLNEQRKVPKSSPLELQQVWASVMSWHSKLGLARISSSWAHCFYLRPLEQPTVPEVNKMSTQQCCLRRYSLETFGWG